jgi:Zn-dependent peptidase ImmA (M78 family)
MATRELKKISPEHKLIISSYAHEYPVKLGSLARELGIHSVKVTGMKTGVSGQITREDGKYVIRVNRNESRERQRFTIAHELAHYLLHRSIIDKSPDGITDNVLYRSGEPETVEFEANRLAAHLVMPSELIKKVLAEDFGGIVTADTIESLAVRFEVSKAAMEIQLSIFSEG